MIDIKEFEKRGALSILFTIGISGNEEWRPTILMRKLECSQDSFYERLKFLQGLGLVEKLKKPSTSKYYVLKLTEKGMKAFLLFKEFLQLLNE